MIFLSSADFSKSNNSKYSFMIFMNTMDQCVKQFGSRLGPIFLFNVLGSNCLQMLYALHPSQQFISHIQTFSVFLG